MKRFALVALLAVTVALTAISPALAATPENPDCRICDADLAQYSGPLSQQEIQGLLLALNDEYHAWAVYDQVIQDLGRIRPFTNIKQSEATHIDALLRLFETYDLPVPENPWVGNVPSFDSRGAACAAGADAEVANVDLYTRILTSTERSDILAVYRSLQQASQVRHLPAFERCAI